jgi:putative ATPase
MGINSVLEDLNNKHTGTIPYYLKDGTSLSLERKYKNSEAQKNYQYPHAYEGHYIKQQYLPDEIKDKRYYEPTDLGYEIEIKKYLNKTKYSPE